jgi:hypothetical protein
MENNEIWTEMWDFPNYEISSLGNVRNLKTGRLLTVRQDGKEYRMVSLYYNKKKYLKRVGRYVWMSFYKQFCSNTIHHKNGDAGDDRLENLTCIPMKENSRYRKDYSRKNKYNLTKEDKGYIHKSITEGKETTWTIMKKYGIPLNYIGTVMKRKSWKKYVGI